MFKDLTEVERKTLTVWAIVGVIVLVLAIIVKIEFIDKYHGNVKLDKKFTIVKDYDRYYTVSSVLTKYYEFINSKDYDAVIKILDEDYVKENKLTVKNVDNKLTSSQANISYKPNIMCKKTIAKGVTEYVVDGKEITQNKGDKIGTKYYKVTLYEEELTFSIKPITKKVYGGECHG